jgi:glycosyltransferase involved in cell wall biosynthesis
VSVWGDDVLVEAKVRMVRVVHRLLFPRAHAVFGNATVLLEAAQELGLSSNRGHAVSWGVDLARFHPGPRDAQMLRSLAVPSDALVVISLRGVAPAYQPHLVLTAFAKLHQAEPRSVLLIVIKPGESGLSDELLGQIRRYRLTRQVRVVGPLPHPDMPRLLRSGDIGVSVPATDGGSVVVAEAMACGLPVVLSDIPAARERVRPGREGLLTPAGDSDRLAGALITLAAAPDVREAMGQHGRHTAERTLDRAAHMRYAEELYRSYVTGTKRWPSTV